MDTATPIESIFLARLSGYLIVSSATLLLCEYINFLSDEMKYIWSIKWSFGKVLYLMIQYPVFFDTALTLAQFFNLTQNRCKGVSIARKCLFIFGIGIVEVMLILRTWVIWNRDKRITNILVTVFLLSFTAMIILSVMGFGKQFSVKEGFAIGRSPFLVHLVQIILAGFETVIIILTIIRALRDRKFYGPRRQMSPVVSVLYRDALINYVYIIILLNVVFLTVFPVIGLPVALTYCQRVAHAIFGSRALLHIRKANERGRTADSLSTIVFHRPAARIDSQSRSFVERVGNDIGEWLAPDPQLYPPVRSAISPITVVTEVEMEVRTPEKQRSPVA